MMKAPKIVADVIKYDLKLLFCGINPGLLSASTQHHFAHPGNKFWKAVHLSGLTKRQLHPSEQQQLLQYGIGITNIVSRPTASAQELTTQELRDGAQELIPKVKAYKPKQLAFLGVGAYKKAFFKKTAKLGLQEEVIGATKVWLLPNPSGLNAHYSLDDFITLFSELKAAAYLS